MERLLQSIENSAVKAIGRDPAAFRLTLYGQPEAVQGLNVFVVLLVMAPLSLGVGASGKSGAVQYG